jgi:hypothetical protein
MQPHEKKRNEKERDGVTPNETKVEGTNRNLWESLRKTR